MKRILAILILALLLMIGVGIWKWITKTDAAAGTIDEIGGTRLALDIDAQAKHVNEKKIKQTIEVLQVRFDLLGVKQPVINQLDKSCRVLIDLPGVTDTARLNRIMTRSGNLQIWETYTLTDIYYDLCCIDRRTSGLFNMLEPIGNVDDQLPQSNPIIGTAACADTASINQLLTSSLARLTLPHNLRFAWTQQTSPKDATVQLIALRAHISGNPALEGKYVEKATAKAGEGNRWNINITMTQKGAKTWQRITRDNTGKTVAMVMDGTVCSTTTIDNQITDGQLILTGRFGEKEAKDMAIILQSDVLPATVSIVQEDIIEPAD